MEEAEKEILETFKRVEVNIPLLDAIKQIPRYAKFLKELCTHKRKLKGNERISMGRNVSALIGKSVPHIPEKCKDPGTFCIPCIIGNNKFENAMLDLGASVSVMPLSIFNSLSLGPLQSTDVVIHLANRSVAYLAGFIEDVMVRVSELIFPVDFYVLNMEEGFSHGSVPIILGRPFMKTARTKIDVYDGTLFMEFGDIVVHFNILDALKHPSKDHSIFRAEIIDQIVDDYMFDSVLHSRKHPFLSDLHTCHSLCIESKSEFEFDPVSDFYAESEFEFESGVVPLDVDFLESKCTNHVAGSSYTFDLLYEVQAEEPSSSPTLVPPTVQPPPTPKLKPLPATLKYAYLEDKKKFPVIISASLDVEQEEKLLLVLKKHKKAIEWTLVEIPGISPSTYMHRILLEDGAKPVRTPQRRLNLVILDVMKKEVTKILQAGIVYPISDSQWVSQVQVVPKKTNLTVIKNERDELIPTRVQNSW